MNDTISNFLEKIKESFKTGSLVKMTLAKHRNKSSELKNIYIRPVMIKKEVKLSFTYRYQTKDVVNNFDINEGVEKIGELLGSQFMKLHLFTTEQDFELSINKKGKGFVRTSAPNFTKAEIQLHDRQKKRWVDTGSLYLKRLEITDAKGKVRPSMNDKYKQINKYIEVVDSLISRISGKDRLSIVDMGAGKGYLTFALYDYLKNLRNMDVEVRGVEIRKELVDLCNQISKESGFGQLTFEQGSIVDFELKKADILIALHACDTATDDAIFKGIQIDASLILCAPCCHKQVRGQMRADVEENPMLKYGILMERQAEMLTDTIRALILEQNGYESNVFEFISNEHTGKNLMIAAVKSSRKVDKESIQKKIDELKKRYGIQYHYLEKLINK